MHSCYSLFNIGICFYMNTLFCTRRGRCIRKFRGVWVWLEGRGFIQNDEITTSNFFQIYQENFQNLREK